MSLRAHFLTLLCTCIYISILGQSSEITERTLSVDRMFVDAKKAALIGSEEQAIVLYNKILELQSDNAVAAFELSKAYLAIDSTSKALDKINFALGNDPRNKWYLLTKIDILKKSDNHAGIIKCYEDLLLVEPQNPDYNRALAFAYVQNDQLKEAIMAFDDMEAKYGVLKNISLIKHDLYKQLGKSKQAEAELVDLIQAYPENVDFQYHLARFYMDEGRASEAENWYKNMLELAPDDSRATIALAQFGNNYGSTDYLKTIRPVLRSPNADIELKIKELMPYVVDLQVTMDEERSQNLIDACYDLVEAHPNEAKAHALLGDVLSLSGKSKEAIKAYNKTVELDPSNYIVWEQLCALLKETRSFEELRIKSDEGLIYFPNQPLLYYFLGSAEYNLGAPDKSLKNYELSLGLSSNNPEVSFNVLPALAKAQIDLEDFDGANTTYLEALKIQPKHPFLNLDYGYFLLRSGRSTEAKSCIELAAKSVKNHPVLKATNALFLASQGNFADAGTFIDEAIASDDNSPFLMEIKGDILKMQGQDALALQAYQSARDQGKGNRGLLRKIEDLQ